ncbi:MAG: fatty acid--CoA ligase [Myxococcota bacterium]|nr:fatty acid--CoA ligase [Myxococcota bacterium]
MTTIGDILRWRRTLEPEGEALWFEGRQTTYAELDRKASQVANALISAGLETGQRVCVLDKSHDAFFETLFGIAKAGGVYTPVNWRLAPPEIAFVIDDAEAPVVFAGEAFAEALDGVRDSLPRVSTFVCFDGAREGWQDYGAMRDAAAETDPFADGPADDTAWQLYTSGTTGHPKGAELTHANLLSAFSVGTISFGGLRADDRSLVCMPLYHIGGSGWAIAAFLGGGTLVVTREANPAEILDLVESQPIHNAFLVPALMNFLIQQPGVTERDFSSLRTILYGASPIPEELLKESLATFGCELIQAYGLTETTGAAVTLPARDHVVGSPRLKACGLPVLGHRIRIAREDGSDCDPGEVGEILIAGPQVMKGYWKRPEANAESIREGWFHSGDAGFLDEDGYLYIHDRVKDMIVSGGENVYPAEVESVLFGHPDVADAAVIGVPDEKWGEAVKAVIVVRPGAELDAQALMDYCQGKIAGYKRPRSVDFIDALPRNPTGKILKRELRERYWKGRDRQVS